MSMELLQNMKGWLHGWQRETFKQTLIINSQKLVQDSVGWEAILILQMGW